MIDPQIAQLVLLFEKRFEFQGVLGSGGFAVVYLVNNLRLSRKEALKVLSKRVQVKPDLTRRFIEEAKYAASLDHPNLVKVYDFGQAEGVLWYSMQYIDGPSLAHILEDGFLFSEDEVLQLAVPLLKALDYSHRRGVVHRDIKSANILLDQEGRPYITDFGLAKTVQDPTQTAAGGLFGTPAYISPEQARGEKLDPRSDLYSLGVTLYRMLSGKFPFDSNDAMEMVMQRLSIDPEPLAQKCPAINPRLERVIMRSLARDREQRFSSAQEMLEGVLQCFGDRPATEVESVAIGQKVAQAALKLARQRSLSMPALSPSDMNLPTRPLNEVAALSRRWLWPMIAGAALLIGAGATLWLRWLQPVAIQPPAIAATISGPAPFGLEPAADPRLISGADPERDRPAAESEARAAATAGAAQPDSARQTKAAAPAPAEPSPAVPMRPVRWPQLVRETTPMFPVELAERCAGELINLSVVVGADGKVQSSRLLSAQRPECVPAVQQALRDYVYEPALNAAGQPVEATIAIAVQLAKSVSNSEP